MRAVLVGENLLEDASHLCADGGRAIYVWAIVCNVCGVSLE